MEKCVRCGEVEEDRRTLKMACFYQMNEMDVPFKEVAVYGRVADKVGDETVSFGSGSFTVPKWGALHGEDRYHSYYTLRVCKGCRADWMAAIQKWFHAPVTVREGCGSGIFVRENGVIKEITMDEWKKLASRTSKGIPALKPVNTGGGA